MYPTQVTDLNSLESCLDRMYEDYVAHCKMLGGGDHVFPKNEWKDMLRVIPKEMLARVIYNFNQRELSLQNN